MFWTPNCLHISSQSTIYSSNNEYGLLSSSSSVSATYVIWASKNSRISSNVDSIMIDDNAWYAKESSLCNTAKIYVYSLIMTFGCSVHITSLIYSNNEDISSLIFLLLIITYNNLLIIVF